MRVAGADANADDERSKNVESNDTPEDTTNGLGNVLARVGGLTGSNGHHLDTAVGESSVDERRPQAREATGISSANVFLHGTFFPVTESTTVLVRGTTKPDDDTGEEETYDRDDLDRCETELSLAIN